MSPRLAPVPHGADAVADEARPALATASGIVLAVGAGAALWALLWAVARIVLY